MTGQEGAERNRKDTRGLVQRDMSNGAGLHLTFKLALALAVEDRTGTLIAVVVPMPGHIHRVLQEQILEGGSQVLCNRLV